MKLGNFLYWLFLRLVLLTVNIWVVKNILEGWNIPGYKMPDLCDILRAKYLRCYCQWNPLKSLLKEESSGVLMGIHRQISLWISEEQTITAWMLAVLLLTQKTGYGHQQSSVIVYHSMLWHEDILLNSQSIPCASCYRSSIYDERETEALGQALG